LPDPLTHVAGALEVEVLGDPVLLHRGALADGQGDRHFSPVAFFRSSDEAVVETEVLQAAVPREKVIVCWAAAMEGMLLGFAAK